MDLFEGLDDGHSPGALPTQGATADEELPARVRHYVDTWPSYVAAMRHAAAVAAQFRSDEDAFGEGLHAFTWDPMGRESIRGLAREAMNAVTAFARKTLCSGDSSVFTDYQARELIEQCRCLHNDESPDFAAYWRVLEKRFGQGRGEALARRRAARGVRSRLGIWPEGHDLGRRRAPTVERGGVRFDLYYTLLTKCFSGGYEVTYSGGADRVKELAENLTTLMGRGYDWSTHAEVFFHLRYEKLKPPHRVEIGGCRWTLFASGTHLWVPQDLALEIRARLDECDPEARDSPG